MSTSLKQQFLDLFAELKSNHPMFTRMETTVEASPWHREDNVLVHTTMVVDEYVKLVDANGTDWTRADYLGALACAFHDVGKPQSEIQKWSESRGNYRAYHGHEQVSARLFEDYACSFNMGLTANEIFNITWMIEHHMPWQIENEQTLNHMALTVRDHGMHAYTNALLADQIGRIADDQEAKNQMARQWTRMFDLRVETVDFIAMESHKPVLYMLIGPSGSGKSTAIKSLDCSDSQVFSLDRLRREFYDATNYENAYAMSVKDKGFEAKANARFQTMVRSHDNLVVDNTNLSRRRRRWYIDQARRGGYSVAAIVMPASVDLLVQRQSTRLDKSVPAAAVQQQYASLQLPMIGEFDKILVLDHNLAHRP